MKVTIELPDPIAADLTEKWDDIPRRILESVAMDGYRRGDLTSLQVGEMLGLHTHAELRAAFRHAGIEPGSPVEGAQDHETEDDHPTALLRRSQERAKNAGERIQKAVRELQQAGILDAEGRRIRTDLPPDMQPDSKATFKH